jgi:hypothetical protein
MNLSLANPSLLWLLSAAALPLLAHLVSRMNPPRKDFPTVEFLRRAMKRIWRWRKPQDWLLLLLRSLALLALAAAFLQPVWLSQNTLTSAGSGKNLLLLLDRSASMQAVEDGQTRFSMATARALEFLRGAGRLDGVNLIWIDAAPTAVLPQMGRSTQSIERALQAASVSDQAGNPAAALRLALERLSTAEGNQELVIFSDFQKQNWQTELPAIPDHIQLLTLPIGNQHAANLGLTELRLQPEQPFPAELVDVIAVVQNYSPEDRQINLVLTSGEQRLTQALQIPANSQGQAIFQISSPPEGESLVQVTLQSHQDALPADDQRWIVLRPRPALRVALDLPEALISPAESAVWQRALTSLSWAQLVQKNAPADTLIFAGEDSATLRLAEAIRAGGGALFFRPHAQCTAPPQSSFLELPNLSTARLERRPATDAEGWRLRPAKEDAAWFQLFADGSFGDPLRGRFRSRLQLPPSPTEPPGWQLLVSYQDQVPAIWHNRDASGASHWWWNASLDPAESTWAADANFLPLLAEALLLSRPRTILPAHHQVVAGDFAHYEPQDSILNGTICLRSQQGEELALRREDKDGTFSWRSQQPLRAGAYQWSLKEDNLDRHHPLAWTSVLFPNQEMDLTALPPEELPLGKSHQQSTTPSRGMDWKKMRDGIPLWPWLTALALVCLLLESTLLRLTATGKWRLGSSQNNQASTRS